MQVQPRTDQAVACQAQACRCKVASTSAAILVAGGCRNVKQYPEAKEQEGMLLVRIDSPIYFANVASIREALK